MKNQHLRKHSLARALSLAFLAAFIAHSVWNMAAQPILVCRPNKSVECGQPWLFDDPVAQGLCPPLTVSVVSTVTNAGCGNTLTATRTWQVTDNCGGRAQCSQTVTVLDTTAPRLTCAPAKTVECGVPWSFDAPTATDNCGGVNVTIVSTTTNQTCGQTLRATRTWQATDACGNASFCSQTVTVRDSTPPTLTCAPNRGVECGTAWSFDAPVATDSCGLVTLNVLSTVTNRFCGNTFSATRTWEAVDACGNRVNCSQTITVVDTLPPTLVCVPFLVVECGTVWDFEEPFVTDDCGQAILTIVSTVTNMACGNSFTATRTWEAADACGNRSKCSQIVTVLDTTPPTITCGLNKTVECGTPWSFDPPVATDTCGQVTIQVVGTVTNRGCGATLTATRTWRVTDECSNTAECSQTVTVRDTRPPTITCAPDKTVECTTPWTFDPPTASDTCGNTAIVVTTTATNAQCGNTFIATRTWRATDDCGNSSTCSQSVVVRDTTAPVITCAGLKTVECGVPWTFDQPTATDLCGQATVRVVGTDTNGGCGNTLTATRTWEATDACGNTARCSQTVRVVDTTVPVITCAPDKTVDLNGPWSFDLPNATDSCSTPTIVVLSTVTNANHCGRSFVATRTWEATDACGNKAQCSQTVTVIDQASAALGDLVWHDANNNGQRDFNELGLDGVVVTLVSVGPDGVPGTPDDVTRDTAITSNGGLYFFNLVRPGNYIVVISNPPAGFPLSSTVTDLLDNQQDNDDNGIQNVVGGLTVSPMIRLDNCETDLTIDFGFLEPASLGNYVWNDRNNNGQVDPGEPGIDGVRVTLWSAGLNGVVGGGDDALIGSTLTSGGGAYNFTFLRPDDYYVVISNPPALYRLSSQVTDTADNREDNDDNGSQAALGGVTISPVVKLSPGEDDPTIDFGFLSLTGIGNQVWNDLNNNGQRDPGELGIDGVTVTLVNVGPDGVPGTPDDITVGSTITSGGGIYGFDNLPPGQYFVVITNTPPGFPLSSSVTDTADNQEDDDDNGIQPTVGGTTRSPVINLSDGETDGTVDFGFLALAAIGNQVWNDRNNNGQRDPGEPGIDGVPVTLLSVGPDGVPGTPDDVTRGNTVTSNGGIYNFNNLIPAQYYVVLSNAPANFPLSSTVTDTADNQQDNDDNGTQPVQGGRTTSPVINLSSGETDNTVDFGFLAPVSIGNLVWNDLNNNGQRDPNEPGIDDVRVTLVNAGPDGVPGTPDDVTVGTIPTSNGGIYQFNNLTPGQYFVVISNAPPGFPLSSTVTDTADNQQDNDDNGIQPVSGGETRSPLITLTDGETDNTVDFGFLTPANIGNLVWNDTNNNGQREPGEPGLDGVRVTLVNSGPDGVPGTPDDLTVGSTFTSNGGLYQFTDLVPGPYFIVITNPPAGFSLSSTVTDTNDNQEDNDDNGSQPVQGGQTTSPQITLGAGETDNTVDFGFLTPTPLRIVCGADKLAECGQPWSFDPATATSGCPPVSVQVVSTVTNAGTCGLTYTATRTYRATDACGNTAQCSQTVRVLDTTPPLITCAGNKNIECGDPLRFDDPNASDTCGTVRIQVISTATNSGCGGTFTARRTWQATDACGNTAECSQTITVRDTTAPSIVCSPDKTAECGSPWSFDPPTASDRCGATTISVLSTVTNPICGKSVLVTRTWAATDGCGNQASCSQTIAVLDTQPPLVSGRQEKTVECTAPWTFDPPSASDACGDVAVSVVSTVTNAGPCGRTFTARRTWQATDDCGNTAQFVQTVTVRDTTSPVILCANDKTVDCTAPWTFDPPQASDTCGNVRIDIVSTVTNAGPCGGGAVIRRTWQATDDCGNVASCSQTVTVRDIGAPTIVCAPNKSVACGTPWTFDPPTATDSCGRVTVVVVSTVTNPLCGATYQATRTWRATDDCGNATECTQVVTTTDTVPPSLFCGPNKSVECGTPWAFDPPTATDNCGRATITVLSTVTNASCGNTFSAIRQWRATDECGNEATCSQVVTVRDTTPPSLTCAPDETVECGMPWAFDPPTVSDACDNPTLRVLSTSTNYVCGQTIVAVRTWEATDGCGNRSTCSQQINVVDTTAPVLACVERKQVECGTPWVFDAPQATDTCGAARLEVVSTVTNATCGGALSATRTWRAIDDCGNTAQCSQTVTVLDTTPPVLACAPDKSLECGVTWTFDPPTATDVCSGPNVTLRVISTVTNGLCGNAYRATRTWEAEDGCGNVARCTQTVTVADTQPPVLICGPDRSVECGTPWTFDRPTATDTCSGGNVAVRIVSTVTNGFCGGTFVATRTWEAEDGCGNLARCTQVVNVVDTTPPALSCAANRTVECGTTWTFTPPTATDSCSGNDVVVRMVSTSTNRQCGSTFVATRTWEASDACGNVARCSQTVTVTDTLPPTLACAADKTVECPASWTFDVPPASDACSGSAVIVRVISTTTNQQCGNTFVATRTWEAEDACGNATRCSQSVRVVDTTPPVLTCAADKVRECNAQWTFDPPTATDACSGPNVVIRVTGTTTNALCGRTLVATRTWTAEDGCGNTATCSQRVTLVDTTAPELACGPDRTVECTAAWTFDRPTAIDACSGTNVIVRILSTTTNSLCGRSYLASRTWEAEDGCGNTSRCSQNVRVVDTTAPVITCAPDKVVECGSPWTFDPPTASDLCGQVTITVVGGSSNQLCGRTFVATRTWRATDDCGNTAECRQTVTVRDTVPPLLVCAPEKTIECGQPWTFDDPVALDICGQASTRIVSTVTNAGPCPGTFSAVRTWEAQDDCGNTARCTQRVNVVDTTPPAIVCGRDKVADCREPWRFDDPTATDACGAVTVVVVSTVTNAISPTISLVSRTWQATDGCGNSARCTQVVTVNCEDVLASLGNLVWNDSNNNGLVDGAEFGVDGVRVTLVQVGPDGQPFTADDVTLAQQTTAGGGFYLFTGLQAGKYFVVITNPPSLYPVSSTPTDPNDNREDNDDNGFQPLGGGTRTFSPVVELSSGETDLTVDFGFFRPVPTLALVTSVQAYETGGQIVVEWQTGSEFGTVGFSLYRLDDQTREWVQVSTDLVPAVNSVVGGIYRVADPGASLLGPNTYILLELEASGTEKLLGPYILTVGAAPAASEGLALGAYVRQEGPAFEQRLQAAKQEQQAADAGKRRGKGTHVKLLTREAGVHFVSAAELAQVTGHSEAYFAEQIENGVLGLYNLGRKVAYLPAAEGAGLYFYAEKLETVYTRHNVYWLAGGYNLPVEVANAAPTGPVTTSWFWAEMDQERDVLPVLTVIRDPEQDHWMWALVVGSSPNFNKWTTTFDLPQLATPAGEIAQVRVRLQGSSADVHRAQLELNGSQVGAPAVWTGGQAYEMVVDVPASSLLPQGNQLRITTSTGQGTTVNLFYIDGYHVRYPRNLVATGGQLEFSLSGQPVVTVSGFTDADVEVWEVSEPRQPTLLENVTANTVDGQTSVTFKAPVANGRYVAFSAGGWKRPVRVSSGRLANLRGSGNAADYVLIAPRSLMDAAQELVSHRQAQGHLVKLVDVEEIQNEFSYGLTTPQAVREMLAEAIRTWSTKPHYVAIAGDGSYDFRDLLGRGDNMVPPAIVSTELGLMPSDGVLGDVDADGICDLAVGRLPVLTSSELTRVIQKIKAYESQQIAGARRALLVADKPDSGGDFIGNSQAIEALIHPAFGLDRAYMSEGVSADTLRGQVLSQLRSGVEWLNYVGHGAFDRMGLSGAYMTLADVSNLNNADRLPLVSAMTCTMGQYAEPGRQCLGEALLMREGGGAIAVWAPTGLSLDAESHVLNRALAEALVKNKAGRTGDLIREAVAEYVRVRGDRVFPGIYNLLGDPALRLR